MSRPDTGGRDGARRPGRLSQPAPQPAPAPDGRPRIRLAAFDLDGTLLGQDLVLSDAVVRALGALRASGVTVIIVTGRMHRTAQRYARELGLTGLPLVSFNGAMVKLVLPEPGEPAPAAGPLGCAGSAAASAPSDGSGDPWWYLPIATDLATRVVTFLAGHGLEPLVFDDDRVYAARPGPVADQYKLIAGIDPEYVGDINGHLTAARVRPTKLLLVHSPEAMPALLAEAKASFDSDLHIVTSYPFFLEFMDRSVGKGRALAEVCRRLGVEPANVAAFGDGLNDLDMITWAGLGVAMGHGPEVLRRAAVAVADGPPGEGVARFIEEHLL